MKAVLCTLLVVLSTAIWMNAQNPASTDVAVTYQINNRHTGAINTANFALPLHKKWSVDMGSNVGYALIVGSQVFVLAGPDSSNQVNLYALDAATGATQWGPVLIPPTLSSWAAAAYDNGKIFVVPYSNTSFSQGAMYAFDAATGNALWTANLTNQYAFTAPPAAANGIVYTGGAGVGGTVYAVNEADGTLLWTGSVANGDNSSPVVTPTGIYVSYVCPQTYKFAPKTGTLIWHYSGPCEGGGGATPVLYNGNLYVRDWSRSSGHDGDILTASSGTFVGTFDADFAPTFYNTLGFYVQAANLTAVTLSTGTTAWTALPPAGDSYSSPPITVNGIVFVGTAQGKLLGYRAGTGKVVVSLKMGYPISAGEGSLSGPQAGLSAAAGMIVVPATTHLIALSH